jgi:hypothetical protein
MSLMEKLSKDIENKEKHPNQSMWDTLNIAKGDQGELLTALRKGTDYSTSFSVGEVTLTLRLLSVSEESAVLAFVNEILTYYPYVLKDNEKKAEVYSLELLKVKLMMATTPSTIKVGSSLLQYNARAQIKYADVSGLTLHELSYLIKEYDALEARFNPRLEMLEESDVVQIIEMVKKSDIVLKDLSYSVLLNIANTLLNESKQLDKILSTSAASSQSDN